MLKYTLALENTCWSENKNKEEELDMKINVEERIIQLEFATLFMQLAFR